MFFIRLRGAVLVILSLRKCDKNSIRTLTGKRGVYPVADETFGWLVHVEVTASGWYLTVPERDSQFDSFDRLYLAHYFVFVIERLLVHEPAGVYDAVHRHAAVLSQHFLNGIQV